jgi:DNA-binding MarR family transcriptional regulator/ribosomal protein S18 acetylase RimI-like enzyme
MRPIDERADAIRDFNRFYTARIGALGDDHLGSPFSLTEVRVLYELAHRENPTASEIAGALGVDRGYLSRTLQAFKRRRFIATSPGADRRRAHLSLTAAGRKAFAPLDRGARDAIAEMLEPLGETAQRRIVEAMNTIRSSLDPERPQPPVTLRTHRSGDMGWIVHRHGVLYAQERGYDERFEALVARVVAGFIDNFDAARERCWIAERNGEILGSVFVVAKSKTVAQLRLLLVEPSARGMGLGRRLVDEVIRFSRDAGYRRVRLWTQSELTSARKIYKAAGFRIVGREGHEHFGKRLEAEVWQLSLSS